MASKLTIMAAINAKVTRHALWRIGLTHDLAERKSHWRDAEGQDVSSWTTWTADSLSEAQEVESHYINKGMKGGTGDNLSAHKTVYVYIY